MGESFGVEKVEAAEMEALRDQRLKALRGPVQDFVEEEIVTYQADFLRITRDGRAVGYACIGTHGDYRNVILEFYLNGDNRNDAGAALRRLVKRCGCTGWLVGTQDFLALPTLYDLHLEHEVHSFLFAAEESRAAEEDLAPGLTFAATGWEEIQEVYQLIMQDDFYTGGGMETVVARLADGELFSLRLDGRLIGVGFVTTLRRTPAYADVAMIIDADQRRQGRGTLLVKALVRQCRLRGKIPTAVCAVGNGHSRRTLQRAGFHLEGCMLLARFGPALPSNP